MRICKTSELAGKGRIFIFGLFSNCLRVKAEGGGMQIEQSDDCEGSSRSRKALPDVRDPYREIV